MSMGGQSLQKNNLYWYNLLYTAIMIEGIVQKDTET